MPVYKNSLLFYDRFTDIAGGGVDYFLGGAGDRVRILNTIDIYWNMLDANLTFTSADSTIYLDNLLDYRRWNTQSFVAGDNIEVVGTALNDGSYTISSISADGLTVTITGAPGTFTDETIVCSVHGTTPITAIDYLANLVPNGAVPTYVSSTDTVTQIFKLSGLDASNTVTQINATVGTKSFGWVTSNITSAATGTTNQVRCRGNGITNYVQSFQILHIFYVTPFWLPSLYANFDQRIAPSFFADGSALKYVCRIDAKYSSISVRPNQSGEISSDGFGAWFDQGRRGSIPGYSVTSIAYEDNVTGDPMEKLDISIATKVTMNMYSPVGNFAATTSTVIICFLACPLNLAELQNTPGTTLLQNLYFDSAETIEGTLPVNGENFGTGYQVITDFSVTFLDPNNLTVEFVFDPGSNLVSYWENKPDAERFYAIYAATQDPAIASTAASDRVNCLADFQSADYDRTNDTLFAFTGSGLYAYEYPDSSVIGVGSIEGFAGDPWVVRAPFKILTDADVKEISFSVVAKKTGRTDFYLEETVIDCTQFGKLLDIQQLVFEATKGLTTYSGDPRNLVTLERDAGEDGGGYAGYVASYGVTMRYESWISAEPQPGNRSNGAVPDVALDIQSVTHRWANYSGVEGWGLVFRFSCTVTDIDGTDNTFISEIPITIYGDSTVEWPSGSGALTQQLQYFDWNGAEGEEIISIKRTGETLVRVTYTGDFALPVTADGWYAWLRATTPTGSIFDSRFASSELESEPTSPWAATDADPLADETHAFGGVRINIFYGSEIIVESIFDSTIYGNSFNQLYILNRLGLTYIAT